MTNREFVAKALEIAKNYKTLYVYACFGAPLTGANVQRYLTNHQFNANPARAVMIKKAANKTPPVYGFDCVNLIKAILWGWSGDASKSYGGATYKANGVPDVSADGMRNLLKDVAKNGWRDMQPGEAVWMPGHIGIYVGDGLVVECTPAWRNCVQVTACGNIGKVSGYNTRNWEQHGKLPWVEYGTIHTTVKVGDIVQFVGGYHYASAAADKPTGAKRTAGKAKVTAIKPGAKHPYHLVGVAGGSNVYGWVDKD